MATESPNNPEIVYHDAATGETVIRPMTDQEYQELLATGWTLDGQGETTE
jgi:hypothetical protein